MGVPFQKHLYYRVTREVTTCLLSDLSEHERAMAEVEGLGKRIARLRNQRGWTQERLAERLAVSRVAVSHIEMELTVPSERTVVLLAGIFHMEPWQLVADSNYPLPKRERLPAVTSRYTQTELLTQMLHNDLAWIEAGAVRPGLWDTWLDRITQACAIARSSDEIDALEHLEMLVRAHIPRK